jgi:hypothetical protein
MENELKLKRELEDKTKVIEFLQKKYKEETGKALEVPITWGEFLGKPLNFVVDFNSGKADIPGGRDLIVEENKPASSQSNFQAQVIFAHIFS